MRSPRRRPALGPRLALPLLALFAPASAADEDSLATLLKQQDWFALRAAIEPDSDALYRAAVDAAFFHEGAEAALTAVIAAAPQSPHAFTAHHQLTYHFIRTSQFQKLAANLDAQQRSFPDDPSVPAARHALGPLLALPDMKIESVAHATVQHDGDFFVPLAINDRSAHFLVDSGAAISSISESEARRLRLEIHETTGSMGTSTTQQTRFRVAIARSFALGSIRLRDVSFAVFSDTQEPWVDLPAGRRGLIGLPVLLAAQRLEWSSTGTAAFGLPKPAQPVAEPNLCLLQDRAVIRLSCENQLVLLALDSGATNTDLYQLFGERFPRALSAGQRVTSEIRGIGGAETHEAVRLPHVSFVVGDQTLTLGPIDVLSAQIFSPHVVGNLGADVLRQHGAFILDFRAMRLDVGAAPSPRQSAVRN